MAKLRNIIFPRYSTILEHRRTVFHLPVGKGDRYLVGDKFFAVDKPNSTSGIECEVTYVENTKLFLCLDKDLSKVCCDKDTYTYTWDKLHHETPVESNPEIVRVEFKYIGTGSSDGRAAD